MQEVQYLYAHVTAVDQLENGTVKDDYRIDYVRKHLKAMRDAIEEDYVDCFGYVMWGPIDIVSAGTGEMKKRYGFVYVDMNDEGHGTGIDIVKSHLPGIKMLSLQMENRYDKVSALSAGV